ncbi:MAG: murein biosynthesis integral membrane protein MurJ [Spirochaetaceae bacterium]|nr:MAG: murein biosynthesis integral membrane protein MurJ [Spirochaetaceae bacterium]
MAQEQSLRRSTLSTLVVMGATSASRLLGFVRVAVIGAIFGGSGEADVLNLVFNIPNNLRKLLAEGALSSAFIPVLSTTIVEDGSGESSRRIVRLVLTLQLVILLPLMLLSVLFSSQIVGVILDFPEPARQVLASDLFRWLIHYLLLISISAVLMGTINSHNRFLVPSLTPLLFSISVIGAIVLLHRRMGIFAMAVGVLAGGVLQILFQVPQFIKLGYDFRPSFRFGDQRFRTVMAQWLPVVGTASIYSINQQVAMLFASGLEDGSGSAMTNALTFWQLPFGIFGASITTVLFPRMSRQFAAGDNQGLQQSLQYGFRYLIALLVPSAVIMGMLSHEIVAVALQRGVFQPRYTDLAARTLRGFCLGLLSVGAFSFFQRFFYATGRFRIPLLTAGVAFVLDVGLSLWLKETRLRVVGLAIANSAAFTVALALMIHQAHRMLGGLDFRRIGVTMGKVTLSVAPVVLFIRLFLRHSGAWWMEGSTLANLLRLTGVAGGAIGILLIMYYFLQVEAFRTLIGRQKR